MNQFAGENQESAFERAREFSSLIGSIPSSFSSTIRSLTSSSENSVRTAEFLISRFLKVPSIRGSLSRAISSIHRDQYPSTQNISDEILRTTFSPHEMASLLTLIYLYRKVNKHLKTEIWDEFSVELHCQAEIGAHIGFAIPKVGGSIGLLVGSMRFFAMSILLAAEEKNFKAYKKYLRQKSLFYDLGREMSTWGTTHVDIASYLIQNFGFGVSYVEGFTFGLNPLYRKDVEENEEAYRWYIAEQWLQTMRRTGKEPELPHRDDFYPSRESMDQLQQSASRITVEGTSGTWMGFHQEEKNDVRDLEAAVSVAEDSE